MRISERALERLERDKVDKPFEPWQLRLSFAGGWSAWQEARELARRHAYEAFGEYQASRQGLEARMRTQRDWAVHGVAKSRKNPKDRDKVQRKFFEDRT